MLLIQTEVADAEMDRRLEALIADRGIDPGGNLVRMSQARACELDLSLPQHRDRYEPSESRQRIEEAVEKMGLGAMVLDPFYDLVGAADMSDRNMQVPGLLRWLASLQAKNCSTICTVMGDPIHPFDKMFGSKYLCMFAEATVGSARRDVSGHLWSDFTWRVEPKRYRDLYPSAKFTLRGKGVGVFEEPPAKAPPAEPTDARPVPDHDEALDIVRASLESNPDLTVRERAEATGITKSRLQRLIKVVEAEL